MVDLAHIARLLGERQPGHGLPGALYNSAEAFDFDMAAIFGRAWIMVGFEVELPRAGGWMAATVGTAPVLITRDRAGGLHAFHNSCRHRGARICPAGAGASARLVCPYHRWTYELSGELVSATRMPRRLPAGRSRPDPRSRREPRRRALCLPGRRSAADRGLQARLRPPDRAAQSRPRQARPPKRAL